VAEQTVNYDLTPAIARRWPAAASTINDRNHDHSEQRS